MPEQKTNSKLEETNKDYNKLIKNSKEDYQNGLLDYDNYISKINDLYIECLGDTPYSGLILTLDKSFKEVEENYRNGSLDYRGYTATTIELKEYIRKLAHFISPEPIEKCNFLVKDVTEKYENGWFGHGACIMILKSLEREANDIISKKISLFKKIGINIHI